MLEVRADGPGRARLAGRVASLEAAQTVIGAVSRMHSGEIDRLIGNSVAGSGWRIMRATASGNVVRGGARAWSVDLEVVSAEWIAERKADRRARRETQRETPAKR